MSKALLKLATVVIMTTVVSGTAYAQTGSRVPLSELLTNVFLQDVVLARTPNAVGVVAHEPLFATDPVVTQVVSLVDEVSQQIGSQLSTFPLGSSSGGFTYSFDPALGTFNRTTSSFGPAFAERAVTVGRGKWNFGTSYLRATYDSLEGRDLEGGDLKFFLNHQALNPPSFVEGDVIQAALYVKVTNDTVAFFTNYGVTDKFDVGIAVPIVHVGADLTYRATILDFATKTVSPTTHLFANGTKQQDFTAQGSATGIGDIVLRTKYSFYSRENGGVAAALDLRLPTGDDQDLLGSGTTQAKIYLILSTTRGRLAPHLNVGYTISGEGNSFHVGDQFNITGGTEYEATPRLTIVGDVIARTLFDSTLLKDVSVRHTFQQGPNAAVESTTLSQFATETGNITPVLGAAGIKYNPWQSLLISAHVLFSLNDAGLTDRVTPVVGFDYSF